MAGKTLDPSVLKKARRKASKSKDSPTKPSWISYLQLDKADDDFLRERPDVVADEDRFKLN